MRSQVGLIGRERSRRTPGVPVRKRSFRTDIQALRALAIVVVVLNHLWPTRVPGGYVGVDVFFVISGYLITQHLVGELLVTGRIQLGAFYARRIRRLLPAALMVLAVSAILVWVFLPYSRWDRNAAEIAASVAYVENWLLAVLAVDYSALNSAASVAQHYWSLSVEEQFYLLWPLLLLAAVTVATRLRPRPAPRKGAIALAIAIVTLSLPVSVWYTSVAPSQAYFATFTRAWEFGLGGLVALFATRIVRTTVANSLAVVGLVAVVISVFAYGDSTAFPGIAAVLPAAGTALVIAAGVGHQRLWHAPLSERRAIQWLGDVSYSLYLWHWPLIVIAPFALRQEMTGAMRVGIVILAVVLAGVTKRFVEDPTRQWQPWATSTRRTVGLMVVGMTVVLFLVGAMMLHFQARTSADQPYAALPSGECVGAAALQHPDACPNAFGPADSTEMTKKNEYFAVPPECGPARPPAPDALLVSTVECDFSGGQARTVDVWLVGDSHAQQWQGAVFELARERDWRVTLAYRGHCPAANVAYIGFRTPASTDEVQACRAWSRDVSATVAKAAPDIVITAMAARQHLVDDGTSRSALDQFSDGLLADWSTWADAGSLVVPIADPPYNGEVRNPDCVALNQQSPVTCARPVAEAQPEDPIVVAAEQADPSKVRLVDLTNDFCDASMCYAVIGGVPVYYDADHLNLIYVRMLAREFAAVLDR